MDGTPWDYDNWDVGRQQKLRIDRMITFIIFKVSLIKRVLAGSITSVCSWGRIFIILASGGTGSAPGQSGASTASAKFDPMSQFSHLPTDK